MEVKNIRGEDCISTAGLNQLLPKALVIKGDGLKAAGFVPHEQIRAGYWWRKRDQVPAIFKWVVTRVSELY